MSEPSAVDRVPGPPVAEALRAAGRDVVEAYYRARFGDLPPSPDESSRLAGALRG